MSSDLDRILVHNHKGGTGKTMLSVHLADHLAARGQQWCLLDADAQSNAMSWITAHEWQGEEVIELFGQGDRAQLVATTEVAEATGYPRLLIDTPPAEDLLEHLAGQVELTPEDLLICPVGGRLAVDGAIKVAEEVAETGCRVVLVANATDPQQGFAQAEIEALQRLEGIQDLGVEVFELAIPRNDKYMREAEMQGVPIWEIAHGTRTHTAKALTAFCEWVASGAPQEAHGTHVGSEGSDTYAISREMKQRLWN